MKPYVVAAVALFVLGARPRAALAGDAEVAQRCTASAERGQLERDQGKLREARASFVVCGAVECPQLVRSDCVSWIGEIDRTLPSLMLVVRDDHGRDVLEFTVAIDGVAASVASGRPLQVDPGNHRVTVMGRGFGTVTVDITAREGELRRPIDVTMVALPVAAPDVAPRALTPPLASWVLFGAGAAALATSGVLFLVARGDLADLRERCRGQCDDAQADGARTLATVADVTLAVGALSALGGALVWWLARPASVPRSAGQPFLTGTW